MSAVNVIVTTPDGKQQTIPLPETNPGGFNVIVHDQGVGVEIPEFVEVNPHDTIDCIKNMTEGEWKWISEGDLFKLLWKMSYDPTRGQRQPDMVIPTSVAALNKMDMGMRHIAGMIVLGCEACFAGRNVFFRTPETYLHPATQRYICEMLKKMLQLTGNAKGTVTATKEDPKNLVNGKKGKKPKAPPVKIEDPNETKARVIKWLECMKADKPIVKQGDKLFLPKDVIEEVKNGTEIGLAIIAKFVECQEDSTKWTKQ